MKLFSCVGEEEIGKDFFVKRGGSGVRWGDDNRRTFWWMFWERVGDGDDAGDLGRGRGLGFGGGAEV